MSWFRSKASFTQCFLLARCSVSSRSHFCSKRDGFTVFLPKPWQQSLRGYACFSSLACRGSKPRRLADALFSRCFPSLRGGHGATLDLVVPGKSLLDSRCSDKQERSTLPWFDRARSWREDFSPSLLAIAQNLFFSSPLFFFCCSPLPMSTRRSD